MIQRFTAAELEALRLFDALIDDAPMTRADYEQIAFNDSLLFPEITRERERGRAARERQKAAMIEAGTYEREQERQKQYYTANRERIKRRKAEWYRRNKERILAQQRAHRMQQAAQITA